jgi:hypothetical protein
MAEGVTQIEQRATSLFALVLGDDLGLHLHGPGDGPGERGGFAGQHILALGLQPLEEGAVAQQTVLDHLGIAGPHLARVERRQHVEVGQHQARLMECAHQILATGCVDGGFAADRRVHLSQQGGRDLNEVDAALVDRRREAREVADHAAAEGCDDVAPVQLKRQQPVGHVGQSLEALGALARRHDHGQRRDPRPVQRRGQPRAVQAPDRLVADHRRAAARLEGRNARAGLIQQAGADPHLVGARAQADRNGEDHSTGAPICSAIAFSTWLTVT